MPVLDSQSFPHILETVVNFASPELLLAFRACSRDLRVRADIRLFEHVEVVFPSIPDDIILRDKSSYPANIVEVAIRPFGSNLTFEWLADPDRLFVPDPTATDADLIARSELRARVQEHVPKARLLDISIQACWGAPANSLMVFLEAWWNIGWERVVLRRMGLPSNWSWHLNNIPSFRSEVLFGGMTGNWTAGRCVLLLDCSPGSIAENHGVESFNKRRLHPVEAQVQHVVLHLLRSDNLDPSPSSHGASILTQILRLPFQFKDNRPAQVTVVGGTEECRVAAGLPATASQAEFYSELELKAALQVYVTPGYRSIRSCIRFVTPDEYAAEVGAEQHAFETKVDSYTGPPVAYIK